MHQLGLTGSDVNELAVSSTVVSRHNGVTHVYFRQRYRDIDVYGAILNVNVGADGQVLGAGHRLVANVARAAGGQNARKTAVDAAEAAAGHLGMTPSRAFEVLSHSFAADEAVTLSDGGIAARPIEARLVWVSAGGGVRLAWSLEIEEVGGQHWWIALVDAETGAALGQDDLVVHDSAQAIAEAVARPDGKLEALKSFPATDGAVYNVFPQPFESPDDGGRVQVANAADPDASPFGWHDTDAVAGPELTVTRGNNVHAYTDLDANNVADPGSDPDGGPTLFFDFPLDLSQNPDTYRPAAVTNLFYWNNVMHDVAHGYGFDEAGGNFQVNNYGNGGVGGDDVRAEAQDGSGTNNANFGTGVEGVRPRMQMFVWAHPFPNFASVNSPGSIAGDYPASRAAFGPSFTTTGPVTRNVTLVNDGVGATSDACEPLVGFPAGDVALLDRGICAFVIKVKNAQNAGADAVIVANNVAGNPITMGGADPTIVIPALMVSLDDGNLLKANLPVNATLRANPLTSINRDSDLDAGVIAHEYGHGISNRLTGGPAVVNCLNNAEQMGEGWSDWFAMTLTTHPSDTATTPRGVGSYVIYQAPGGRGIRPTQYTTDLSVNPATYAAVADTTNISQPHGIGYVWNSMLWEVYWNLVDAYGYNADVYGDWTTGGNNLALQLVMDGMKFQVCRPGFVDGRNAILQADLALTGGSNQCEIWRGFAKRGLGFSASQGSSLSRLDGVEAFDLPASCTAAVFGGFHPPVDGPTDVNGVRAGSVVPVKFTLSGAGGVLSIDSQPVDCVTLEPTGEAPQPPAMPGSTGLTQHGDKYHFNWQTDASWAGTCRRLTLRIPAPSDAYAYFSFL
ncbi:MAG TPA: M36 family metallopeptidase [Thermoanaerobaculia bacterium]